MGHHYVPQFYLRGFTVDNTIWVHDRPSNRSFLSQPKTIANENNLYTEELETHLANSIEYPAMNAIEKIRERVSLDENERFAIARYVVTLWKRVPRARARVAARMPELTSVVRDEIFSKLELTVREKPHLASAVEARKSEIDMVLERYESEVPPDIWQKSLNNYKSEIVVDSLLSMNWRFFYSKEHQFLTCDNPVFFFEHEGIGKNTSEMTVPFSSSVTMWASRRDIPKEKYIQALPGTVREVNRRIASNATRFVYSARQEHWILPFVLKGKYALNRLI